VTPDYYSNRVVALPTRHSKEIALAPAFHQVLSATIDVIDVDTDSFGTFTGDIPRTRSPLKSAEAKAHAGLAASGNTLAVASEGTIGPDPSLPFANSDIEVLVFVDTQRQITIHEQYRSNEIVAVRHVIGPGDDLSSILHRADFPNHAVLVKPESDSYEATRQNEATHRSPPMTTTGITDTETLQRALAQVHAMGLNAVIESDFRACFSPSRMANITECARRLVARIATNCPACASPGWGLVAPSRGLPCRECGTHVPTAVRSHRLGCPRCEACVETPSPDSTVDPRWCPRCNP